MMTDFTTLQPNQAYQFRKTKLIFKYSEMDSTKAISRFIFENTIGVEIELSANQITQHLQEVSS